MKLVCQKFSLFHSKVEVLRSVCGMFSVRPCGIQATTEIWVFNVNWSAGIGLAYFGQTNCQCFFISRSILCRRVILLHNSFCGGCSDNELCL